jgi:hypothetical protein
MRFDANQVRSTRKLFQWSVVPMVSLAVLTLGRPLLPLLLCLTAISALGCAVVAGTVEEQIDNKGSSWLWRRAMALPRREEWSAHWCGHDGDYRSPPREEVPSKVIARRLHWFTRAVAMMPVWMGGGGLGWKLWWRSTKRGFDRWDRTPSDASDRFVQRIVDELRRRENLRYVRSTHVDCPGAECVYCKDIADGMKNA